MPRMSCQSRGGVDGDDCEVWSEGGSAPEGGAGDEPDSSLGAGAPGDCFSSRALIRCCSSRSCCCSCRICCTSWEIVSRSVGLELWATTMLGKLNASSTT